METLEILLKIVTLGALSALCFSLISFIGRLRMTVSTVENTLSELSSEMKKLNSNVSNALEKLDDLSTESSSVLENLNTQLLKTGQMLDTINSFSPEANEVRNVLRTGVIQPLKNVSSMISAATKGANAFLTALSSTNKSRS